jgi:sulfide dehydrogenase cytochrome subunit
MKNVTRQSLKFAVGLVLATGMGAAVAEVPAAGQACVACHGETGASTDPNVPNIGGVGSFFLENQFIIYADGDRPCAEEAFADHEAENHCTIMAAVSEDDVLALSEYYGDQEYVPFEQDFDAALAEQGAGIHDENCSRCHTAGGAEVFDDAGILAGQPIPYMTHQLELYQANERWQPESKAEVTTALDADQIKALANYYAAEGLN